MAVGLSFTARDTVTSCGVAAGVRVTIDRGTAHDVCTAVWATAELATSADDSHLVADCLFVVTPGLWTVTSIEVLGIDGAALTCCAATYPATLAVTEGATSELGAMLSCAAPSSGAIDILGWLDRPPEITGLRISPSKFVAACTPVELTVVARDREGDALTYAWEVSDAPTLAHDWSLVADGAHATFTAESAGTYTLVVTVRTEAHEAEASLTFPLHIMASETTASCAAPPDTRCIYSQGFWKNHPSDWPSTALRLGAMTYLQPDLLALLATPPRGDATRILAIQLVAAKLNVANGARSACIEALILDADNALVAHHLGSNPRPPDRELMVWLADDLANFNEGQACLVPEPGCQCSCIRSRP